MSLKQKTVIIGDEVELIPATEGMLLQMDDSDVVLIRWSDVLEAVKELRMWNLERINAMKKTKSTHGKTKRNSIIQQLQKQIKKIDDVFGTGAK